VVQSQSTNLDLSSPRQLRKLLQALDKSQIQTVLASLNEDQAEALRWDWELWARDAQLEPSGDWAFWLILAGRGFGKTRSGAEWVRSRVEAGATRVALVAATAADARDTMVLGESGLLAVCPPHNRPVYEPSKRSVTWPNGAVAKLYSAEKPDRLRGPQHEVAWCDEVAAWSYPQETWDNLLFGLRLGASQCVVTTTPRPTTLIKQLVKDATVTTGTTYDNQANLSQVFLKTVLKKYEGTRLGLQELHARLLEDTPGALWNLALLEQNRVQYAPELIRVVVAVDPAVTNNENSSETGIVVAGVSAEVMRTWWRIIREGIRQTNGRPSSSIASTPTVPTVLFARSTTAVTWSPLTSKPSDATYQCEPYELRGVNVYAPSLLLR